MDEKAIQNKVKPKKWGPGGVERAQMCFHTQVNSLSPLPSRGVVTSCKPSHSKQPTTALHDEIKEGQPKVIRKQL